MVRGSHDSAFVDGDDPFLCLIKNVGNRFKLTAFFQLNVVNMHGIGDGIENAAIADFHKKGLKPLFSSDAADTVSADDRLKTFRLEFANRGKRHPVF